ncbi:antitermination protein [Serratia sp. UGAL515B_01]|uniref:antitermination protein n=1 Tax=Serratia sp. UGAL515B_01 TaxID=2986763 RepID=UPI0029530EB7|nr:antitermination protein [Serratia sp. UGAL515B_01]WON77564.1 antitermination protein [Serratia sp. UGAL515B_01]
MNLDSVVKYHFAKSTQINDSPRGTSSDTLTGTDVMAAMGMCQSRAPLGYSAFLGKMEISDNDKKRAVQLLTQYGMSKCDKVAALRKLDSNVKAKVVQTLAKFAFKDYSRSAAGVERCECCRGSGFLSEKRSTGKRYCTVYNKGHGPVGDAETDAKIEEVKVICKKCNGKGVVSVACCKCNGRGEAVHREETERQGVPVKRPCKQCLGRGYERIPTTKALQSVSAIAPSLTLDIWKRGVKPFYEDLIAQLEREESFAETQLKRVTSNIAED